MRGGWLALVLAAGLAAAGGPAARGPGLAPQRLVLPARYFSLELGEYSPEVVSEVRVELRGKTASGAACRLWVNTLDRRDGTLIVRYKLYETCYHFSINIFHKDKHITGSPYTFPGPIQPDHCYCPENNFTKWMEQYGCPSSHPQVTRDLEPFSALRMQDIIGKILSEFNRPHSISLCHYAIKNNEVYRKCYGEHVGFNMFSDNILLSLARKVRLPDTQFFMNLGDWPLAKKTAEAPLPVFSWCGSNDTYDIVMPTYDITESTLENMGRVMLDMLSVQGNSEVPWSRRVEKVFWRGRDSRQERLTLIDIARQHPDLFNASLTNFFFFRDKEPQYGPKQPHESFFKFFDYKYQINIDGTVAAYRFPYLLAGGSLVFKQDSPYYEHFYGELEPFVHYVPVKRDLSDLLERVRWARQHDDEARSIADRGQRYARDNLAPQEIICYHALLLSEWSKRVLDEVVVGEEMTLVKQSHESGKCTCEPDAPGAPRRRDDAGEL